MQSSFEIAAKGFLNIQVVCLCFNGPSCPEIVGPYFDDVTPTYSRAWS